MQTFSEYAASFSLHFDPLLLDISPLNSEYCLFSGSEPLLTPGGHLFSHLSEDLIRLLLTDLQLNNATAAGELNSPLLFSFYLDKLASGEDPLENQWSNLLSTDPFVQIKTGNVSSIRPFSPEEELFSFSFQTLSGLVAAVNRFTGQIMGEISLEEEEQAPFPEILKLACVRLSLLQKAVLEGISWTHQSGIVLPLLLVTGEISPAEYAKGLVSLRMLPLESMPALMAALAGVKSFLEVAVEKPSPEKNTRSLISEGEGDRLEFKSTLRWDIRAGKTNPAIERACLKTISAFLNTSGGTLLIGIRDDGSAEGIETDKFPNEDKFLLHLWTLIRTCLGRDFSPYVRTILEKIEEKTICRVNCSPVNRPVFLRQPGYPEELFIRMGPSSNALEISEALKYISDRFAHR